MEAGGATRQGQAGAGERSVSMGFCLYDCSQPLWTDFSLQALLLAPAARERGCREAGWQGICGFDLPFCLNDLGFPWR